MGLKLPSMDLCLADGSKGVHLPHRRVLVIHAKVNDERLGSLPGGVGLGDVSSLFEQEQLHDSGPLVQARDVQGRVAVGLLFADLCTRIDQQAAHGRVASLGRQMQSRFAFRLLLQTRTKKQNKTKQKGESAPYRHCACSAHRPCSAASSASPRHGRARRQAAAPSHQSLYQQPIFIYV